MYGMRQVFDKDGIADEVLTTAALMHLTNGRSPAPVTGYVLHKGDGATSGPIVQRVAREDGTTEDVALVANATLTATLTSFVIFPGSKLVFTPGAGRKARMTVWVPKGIVEMK